MDQLMHMDQFNWINKKLDILEKLSLVLDKIYGEENKSYLTEKSFNFSDELLDPKSDDLTKINKRLIEVLIKLERPIKILNGEYTHVWCEPASIIGNHQKKI